MPCRMLLFAAAFQNGCRSRMALQLLSFAAECFKGPLKLHCTQYLLLRENRGFTNLAPCTFCLNAKEQPPFTVYQSSH